MTVKVYVEGGGDSRELDAKCRSGFRGFFGKSGLAGRLPKVVPCGSRRTTFDRFRAAVRAAGNDEFIVLLVDSEGPVEAGDGPWLHLKKRDRWNQPPGTTDDNAHLIVQLMESWFLADKECLAVFFGPGFRLNALPRQQHIENIAKRDVLDGLKNATRQCGTKGTYDKGRHSFDILSRVDPGRVTRASAHARRLLDTLSASKIPSGSLRDE